MARVSLIALPRMGISFRVTLSEQPLSGVGELREALTREGDANND